MQRPCCSLRPFLEPLNGHITFAHLSSSKMYPYRGSCHLVIGLCLNRTSMHSIFIVYYPVIKIADDRALQVLPSESIIPLKNFPYYRFVSQFRFRVFISDLFSNTLGNVIFTKDVLMHIQSPKLKKRYRSSTAVL